jgi:hypothetical protein
MIVMEDRDSSFYAAIDRVADKAGRVIGRRIKRHRGSWRVHENFSIVLLGRKNLAVWDSKQRKEARL